ncbi:hypothetical protein BDZ85DRAFT_268664 [Elsinoe ampelina]|uniref:Uncharacterized protein n=1 Tax=Elsinoe ampelina TaxID=302913 RepID=A0A6A6G1Q4_9PEZI|nr:hypothetical protein BDZ85DRAFT_268664 [Elsinoe ampelina]
MVEEDDERTPGACYPCPAARLRIPQNIETAGAVPGFEVHPLLGSLPDRDCGIFYFFNMTPMEGLTERTIGFGPDELFLENGFNGPRPSWTKMFVSQPPPNEVRILIASCCETLECDIKVKREGGVTWGHLAAEILWALSLDHDLGPEALLFYFKISDVYLLQEAQPRRQEATCQHCHRGYPSRSYKDGPE